MSRKYNKGDAEAEIVNRLSGSLPAFGDLFDEETFYIFAIAIVLVCIVGACVAARFVNLKDADHRD